MQLDIYVVLPKKLSMAVAFDKIPSGAEIMSTFGGSTKRKIYMHDVMQARIAFVA